MGGKKRTKGMMKKVATNVIASRPTGTPTTRANYYLMDIFIFFNHRKAIEKTTKGLFKFVDVRCKGWGSFLGSGSFEDS